MTYSEYLVLSPIYFNSHAMCKKHIVGCDIRLCCGIAICTVSKSSGTAPRCRNPNIEAQMCETRRFVYSTPVLDTVPKSSKTFFCKKSEILPKKEGKINYRNAYACVSMFWKCWKKYHVMSESYTTFLLRNPPYSFSRVCGKSQWYRVTKGSISAI